MAENHPFTSAARNIPPIWVLDRIRGNSCYRALRTVIDITALALALIPGGLMLVAFSIWLEHTPPAGTEEVFQRAPTWATAQVTAFLFAGASAFGMVFVFAFRQAAYVLIDIADLLLEMRRDQSAVQPPE